MSLQVAKLDCTRRKDNSDYRHKKCCLFSRSPLTKRRKRLCDVMMKFSMTSGAKSYKIFLAVVTQVTPKLNMVNLQFARSSTILASPIISF